MPSILFICVYNACRSQIAEAVFRKLASDSWLVASVGTNPSGRVDPKAIEILKKHRLTMNSIKPKGFSSLSTTSWDYIVRMDGGDKCLLIPAKKFIKWDVPDPEDGPMGLYEALFNDITKRSNDLMRDTGGTTL